MDTELAKAFRTIARAGADKLKELDFTAFLDLESCRVIAQNLANSLGEITLAKDQEKHRTAILNFLRGQRSSIIRAIKEYRQFTGKGLKESKFDVESVRLELACRYHLNKRVFEVVQDENSRSSSARILGSALLVYLREICNDENTNIHYCRSHAERVLRNFNESAVNRLLQSNQFLT